jgi:hypothetical protein
LALTPSRSRFGVQSNLERWYGQYLLAPLPPDGQRFKQAMFQYRRHPFEAQGREVPHDGLVVDPDRLTKYMSVDPATSVSPSKKLDSYTALGWPV